MSLFGLIGGNIPDRISDEDHIINAQGTRDGALITAEWVMARAAEGLVYVANAGVASTPITFGAGAIDTTEPDLHGAVPASKAVVLVEISVTFDAFGTTALLEGMASIGRGGTAGTDTAVTPTNLRTDAPNTSSTVWGSASAADATYSTTNVSEFWRFSKNKVVNIGTADDDSTDVQTTFTWKASDSGVYPIMVGASQLQVFAASQAGTGFIRVVYVEVPVTMFS